LKKALAEKEAELEQAELNISNILKSFRELKKKIKK